MRQILRGPAFQETKIARCSCRCLDTEVVRVTSPPRGDILRLDYPYPGTRLQNRVWGRQPTRFGYDYAVNVSTLVFAASV